YTPHWSFVPPVRPAVPHVGNAVWVRQSIDAFVLQRLEAEGLKPSREAAPDVWLRRVTLDLTGLPPSLAELDAFPKEVQARGEAAYIRAVDRLLASPAYGERMGMDWLDVARYADTHGFNNDSERSMWRWRDWVINSFNGNMPYNRFLTEQLAGDLLPHPTLDQRIATGFERNHVINSEGGIIEEEYRSEYVTDRVRTLGMAWLGLTLECAHCHDHKFDPITQRDHYRFYAFFNNVAEIGEDGRVANAVPIMPAPTVEQQRKMQELQTGIDRLSAQIDRREKSWRLRESVIKKVVEAARQTAQPGDAAMKVACETPQDGVAAKGCETSGKGVAISKRRPLTFSFWLNPAAGDTDAALLSAIDYSQNPAATTYGNGIEVRLVNGEIEFRFSDRFPAYSIRVRSQGAQLTPEQWRHVAVVYSGAGKEDMRARASWVRMFVDGRELPTVAQNDDLALPDEKSDKPKDTKFRVGWDNLPKSAKYRGSMDEANTWNRELSSSEIAGIFARRALPSAAGKEREHNASPVELGWLCEAALRQDAKFAQEWTARENMRAELFAVQRDAPTVMVMQEMAKPRETHVLIRGSYDVPGEKVEPGVPEQLLGAWPKGAPVNRLGLAEWLTKPDHPLTSRVVVNRFWQQLFGEGIVKTSDNFGMQGEWPSHPELLDWLAREFIDSGWNVKALMKTMVLSATYR
ncbi:MAG TPA: DUF1549 domain-containing protein, partial [Bryobacteraceae bacterium]|nr:DUF1549 domain-containing protein [Bryobacteraceae bacterium]